MVHFNITSNNFININERTLIKLAERKSKKTNQEDDILNSPALKEIIEKINDNTKETTTSVYGVTQEFIDDNNKDFNNMKNIIRKTSDKYKQVTGINQMDFLAKVIFDQVEDDNNKKSLVNINNLLENPNNNISEIFANERSRFTLYEDYESLYNYIPQLSQAIEAFVDNIISPDDFTKDIFSIFYNDMDISASESKHDNIVSNIVYLEKLYKIENKTKEWIRDVLVYGEKFVAVLPLENEFNKMLGESTNLNESLLLNENNVLLSENEEKELNDYFKEYTKENNIKSNKNESTNWKQEISRMLNENVKFSTNRYSVIKDELILESEFKEAKHGFENINTTDLDKVKRIKSSDGTFINTKLDDSKKETVTINGSCKRFRSKTYY